MNESAIRERLREAVGDATYPPGLTSRIEARLKEPQGRRQYAPRFLALVAALLAVAIVVTLVFTARSLHSKQSLPVGPQVVPTSQPGTGQVVPTSQPGTGYTRPSSPVPVKMIDPNNGWASGALRTTDGGAHWRDVSPPSLPNRQGDAPEFYLDLNHAWQGQAFADHVVIFRTADGGLTWQQGAAVPVKATDQAGVSSQLYFIDYQHGWLKTESCLPNGFACNPDPAAQGLYSTVDGGLHWTLQSSGPGAAATGCFFGDGMTFVSTARGWLQLSCPPALGHSGLELLVTSDGGVTWHVQTLAKDSRCPCFLDNAPVFFDQQHGFVQGSASNGPPFMFATTDGGSIWSARTIPGADPGLVRLSFIDASAGWAIVDGNKKGPIYPSPTCSSGYAYSPSECFPQSQMYRTADGGRTWALMQTDLFSPDGEVNILLFVDARYGFAQRYLSSPQNLQPVLLKTSDGGSTWQVVAAAIVGH
jgi:photosystem II stability/assembly factor-like uncharacterized protein